MLRKFLTLSSVLMLVVLCAAASPQGDDLIYAKFNDSKALLGAPGAHVLIESMPKVLEGIISADNITTDVELKLRQSGIRVLTREDDKLEADTALLQKRPENVGGTLYVNIGSIKTSPQTYVFKVSVEYDEDVTVQRGKQKLQVLVVPVWEKSAFGTVGSDHVTVVRDDIKDFMDQFCNDYLKANPKK